MIEISEKEAYEELEKHHQRNDRLKIYFGEASHEVFVFVDGFVIGLIQELKIHATAEGNRTIEITFPQFDKEFYPAVAADLDRYIKILQSLPNIKITLRPLKELPIKTYSEVVVQPVWNSSEEDFQKSLDMVKDERSIER